MASFCAADWPATRPFKMCIRDSPSILLAFKIARRFEMRIEDVFIYQEEDHEE